MILGNRANRRSRALLVAGLAFCISPALCLSQSGDKQEPAQQSYSITKFVEGKVPVELSTPQLKLGIENKITIKSGRHQIYAVYLDMHYYGDDGQLLPNENANLDGEKITYNADGDAYVTIEPDKVGKVRLNVLIDLDSGERDAERKETEVILPDQLPDKFMIAQGGSYTKEDVGSVYLDLSTFTKALLGPRALYKGAKRSVDLPVKDVSYSLITEPGRDSPVSLDNATGTITALHSGRVLVEAKFREMSVLTCVDVGDSTEDEVRRHDCDDMVPEGMTIRHPLDRVKELHSKQVPSEQQ